MQTQKHRDVPVCINIKNSPCFGRSFPMDVGVNDMTTECKLAHSCIFNTTV